MRQDVFPDGLECRSISEHNGVKKMSFARQKPPASRYAPIAPM